MQYLGKNKQDLEKDYIYKAADGSCQSTKYPGQVSVAKVNTVLKLKVDQLKAAIALGPTSVTLEADTSVF
jgi:hypothetical protein